MYSAALNAIINIGIMKVVFTTAGIVFGLGSVVIWFICWCVHEGNSTDNEQLASSILSFVIPILCAACLAGYNMPFMREEIVIAKTVAPILDKYAEQHPESIYNPDVTLDAIDTAVKGIVDTTVNLPKYVERLAKGQPIFQSSKTPADMTKDELLEYVKKLEAKK